MTTSKPVNASTLKRSLGTTPRQSAKSRLRGIEAATESRHLIDGLGALDDLLKKPGLRSNQRFLHQTRHAMLSRLADLTGTDVASLSTPELSGAQWVTRFPGSNSTDTLADAFRSGVEAFVGAMRMGGVSVTISATLRPVERAYLMHWSWIIARLGGNPKDVPQMDSVDILWDHGDAAASMQAAEDMVQRYGIVAEPALTSRHTQGLAIDMTISWAGNLAIAKRSGAATTITSKPRTGMNIDLIAVGATYGVIKAKFGNDPPHWSNDGH